MAILTACLKTQISNQPAKMQSFADLSFTKRNLSSTEQLSVLRLLLPFFTGRSNWDWILPSNPDNGGGMGGLGDALALPDDGEFSIGYRFNTEHPLSLAAFNETEFRQGIAGLQRVFKPIGFDSLVNETALADLQQLIDDEINSENPQSRVILYTEPVTLRIQRSTQSDIDALFIGGVPRHVDMFDSLLEMIPHHSPTLDGINHAPAWYDQRTDEILFKSNYGIHREVFNVT